jgi:hypothetical protein
MHKASILVTVLVAACGSDARTADTTVPADSPTTVAMTQRACGVSGSPILTDSGVGAFSVGAPVERIKAQCTVVSDTVLRSGGRGSEGNPQRELTVALGSARATAVIEADRVRRVFTESPLLRSATGFGVGTTVGAMRSHGARLSLEEGAHIFLSDHCGFGFDIDLPSGRSYRTIDQLPDSVSVNHVYVFGCRTPR